MQGRPGALGLLPLFFALLTLTTSSPPGSCSPELVVITGYWSTGLVAARAAQGLPVKVVVEDAVIHGLVPVDDVKAVVSRADTVMLVHTTGAPGLGPALGALKGKKVFVYDNVLPAPPGSVDLSRVEVDWDGVKVPLSLYLQSRSVRNMRSLLEYVLTGKAGPFHPFDGWVEGFDYVHGTIVRPPDPTPGEVSDYVHRYGSERVVLGGRCYPAWFVHMLEDHLKDLVRTVLSREPHPRGPAVLVVCDSVSLECGWTAPVEAVCRALVREGLSPLVLAFHYDLLDGDPEGVFEVLRDVVEGYHVRAIVFLAGFFRMFSPDSPEVKVLESMGVPVIKAIRLNMTMTGWQAYWRVPGAMDWAALYDVVIPENLGMIEGIPVSVREWRKDGPETLLDRVWRVDVPVRRMVEILAERVEAWVRLQTTPNREKKVVILYWAVEPGREGVGIASSLDVPASIVNFLAWLAGEGYDVEVPEDFVRYLERFEDEVPAGTELAEALRSGDVREVLKAVKDTLLEIYGLERKAAEEVDRGDWAGALRLYARAYGLIRPLADALGRMMTDEGSNIGAYILRRVKCEGRELVLDLLAYENGRFVKKRWVIRYVYLMPLSEYLRWYRSLPEWSRLCIEKGVFGYLESLLLCEKRYGPIVDRTELRSLEEGLESMLAYIEGHLDYVRMPGPEKEEFVKDLRRLFREVADALSDPSKIEEALRDCEREYERWSKVKALYGWFTGWGPPQDSPYLVDVNGRRYFVIRGIDFGNVLVAPQPARGYYASIGVAYHSTVLPPCHYYLACYLYFTRVFGANVIVNTGKHGTYEWLPYKPMYMSWWDFPQLCIGDVPQVYPYYVADPSEALVAKRRGWAVIVNHLPQTLESCHLWDGYAELEKALHEYLTTRLGVYKDEIVELLKKTRAYELLNMNSLSDFEKDFDGNCARLYFLLHDLEDHDVTPVGLHVFGMPPLGTGDPVKAVASFAAEILRNVTMGAVNAEEALKVCEEVVENPKTRHEDRLHEEAAELVEKILESAVLEMEDFLKALSGGYVPPGYAASPFKELDSLPTGRNSCMFDPRKWPDRLSINPAYTVALPLRMVARKVVALNWATDNINTRALPIAVEMLLMGCLPRKGPSGIVIGVDPCAPLKPNALVGTRGYGQVLIVGKVVSVKRTGEGSVMEVEPPTGGVRVRVTAPPGVVPEDLKPGDWVTILGTLIPEDRRVELMNARVIHSNGPALTPSELLALGAAAVGEVEVRGEVLRAEGRILILTDGKTEVECLLSEPAHVEPGETVTVEGFPLVSEGPPVVSASLVLRGRLENLTDAIVLGTACFRDVFAYNILSELFASRVAAVFAAEPYLAEEIGVTSLLGIEPPKGSDPVEAVLERLRSVVNRLEKGGWHNPIHDTVLAVYERALREFSNLDHRELAKLLWNGLETLYEDVQKACRTYGISFESITFTASQLAYLTDPAHDYPFLDWAVTYLALLACRHVERAPLEGWVDQIRKIPTKDLPLLAAENFFSQAPGDYTNVIGKAVESGMFFLNDRLALALSWISGMCYVYGPGYWGVPIPLLLALQLAAPDYTLHTMASSDEKATFFYDDCIYAFDGGLRLAVEAVNGLTPRREKEIPMLVLNLRNAAACTLTGGGYRNALYQLAKVAELLEKTGRKLPWLSDLVRGAGAGEVMAATLLGTLTALMAATAGPELDYLRGNPLAAYRFSMLMPFQTYAWYDLMRTVYNPLYIEGEKYHGYAGAVDLLKRLDFLITGWSTLTPGLLDWTAIFRRTAELLVRERQWLMRYAPESLLSVSVRLLVVAYDRAKAGLVESNLLESPEFLELVRDVIEPLLERGELCCCPAVCGNPIVQSEFLKALSTYETLLPGISVIETLFRFNYEGKPVEITPNATPTTTPTTATRTPTAHPTTTTRTHPTTTTATTRPAASTTTSPTTTGPTTPSGTGGTAPPTTPGRPTTTTASYPGRTSGHGGGGGPTGALSLTGAALTKAPGPSGGGATTANAPTPNAGAEGRAGAHTSAKPTPAKPTPRTMSRSSPTLPSTGVPRWMTLALVLALLASILLSLRLTSPGRRPPERRGPAWIADARDTEPRDRVVTP